MQVDRFRREQLFIDGAWQRPASGELLPVHSPASEQQVGVAPLATAPDVERAVAAARRAFESGPWPRMAPAERADVLLAIAEQLKRAAASSPSSRSTSRACRSPTRASARTVRSRSSNTTRGSRASSRSRAARGRQRRPALVLREPVGVVAAIVPFNGR
jgi:acyl-CoA reductase-like NAD-dependent aldehyde dehydrogenase